jgi:hypothetical protein
MRFATLRGLLRSPARLRPAALRARGFAALTRRRPLRLRGDVRPVDLFALRRCAFPGRRTIITFPRCGLTVTRLADAPPIVTDDGRLDESANASNGLRGSRL